MTPIATPRALIVDDEEDAREALRLILQQNGMLVTTAASAREAYELVERLQPDILLSDIAMPGEDGLSLIRRVRMRRSTAVAWSRRSRSRPMPARKTAARHSSPGSSVTCRSRSTRPISSPPSRR